MRRRLTLTIGLAGLVAGLALVGSSFAASFDCGHAASPREKLICSDPTLSDLDSKLGRLYQERRALLSPHGADLLQTSERSWLTYTATVCTLAVPDHAVWSQQPKNCLALKYRDRLKQLSYAGEKVGPFLFNRIDFFSAEPAPDNSGQTLGFYVQHIGYPQIDGPSSSQADEWNRQSAKTLEPSSYCGQGDSNGDEDADYVVGYATQRFISVKLSSFIYCHGAAHGTFGSGAVNMVLQPTVRPATEQDIFGPNDDWVNKFQQILWKAVTKNGWRPLGDAYSEIESDVEDDFIQPARWIFTIDGLRIAFSAYDAGCYQCNPPPVTVPWSEIKPLLPKKSVLN